MDFGDRHSFKGAAVGFAGPKGRQLKATPASILAPKTMAELWVTAYALGKHIQGPDAAANSADHHECVLKRSRSASCRERMQTWSHPPSTRSRAWMAVPVSL